jgi:hypothetical protein
MVTPLTLRSITHLGSVSHLTKGEHVSKYEVCGLPLGERAKIGEMSKQHWQILLTKDGMQGAWEGDYESGEDALAMVQKQFEEWRY